MRMNTHTRRAPASCSAPALCRRPPHRPSGKSGTSPSREHRENVSYRLGKWEYDHGLGLEFRFPVSLPHTFYMRNGFVSEIRAPQKVIMRNRLDMFSEGRVSQKRSRFACKMYGGSETGNRNSTLTHDHIPIYPVYNSCFPCVPAKGCVRGLGCVPTSARPRRACTQ